MNYFQKLYIERCGSFLTNLHKKLEPLLESPVICYERFKVTLAPFSIPDFDH